MAETFFPFDDAPVYEAQWEKMARLWLPDGVAVAQLSGLAVGPRAAGANRSVDVAAGRAWLNGHFYESDAVENLPLSPNASGNPRIDRIVVRLTYATNTVALAVLEGAPAPAPAQPALTQTAAVWEIPLASVAVANGYAQVLAADLDDERLAVPPPQWIVRRKTTAKVINTSVAETDLLNGEMILRASEIGAGGYARLRARGDWLHNVAGPNRQPRIRFKLGGTTLWDSNVDGTQYGASAVRWGWQADVLIAALGSEAAQWIVAEYEWEHINISGTAVLSAAGIGGLYNAGGTNATYGRGRAVGHAAGAIDLTQQQLVELTAELPASNAAVEIALKEATLEVVRC